MKRFKSAGQARRFRSAHDGSNEFLHLHRDRLPVTGDRASRAQAFCTSAAISEVAAAARMSAWPRPGPQAVVRIPEQGAHIPEQIDFPSPPAVAPVQLRRHPPPQPVAGRNPVPGLSTPPTPDGRDRQRDLADRAARIQAARHCVLPGTTLQNGTTSIRGARRVGSITVFRKLRATVPPARPASRSACPAGYGNLLRGR